MRMVWLYLTVFCLGISTVFGQSASWDTTAPFCQILDASPDSVCSIGIGYVPSSRFEGYRKTRMAEVDATCDLAYYRDVLLGDIDVSLNVDGSLLFSSGNLQLPDQLLALAPDVGWTWRYINGSAVQVRAAPGIYSDIEELAFRSFALPFSVAGVMTFSPELSATVGMKLRPGFDQLFMPIVGAVWGPSDWLRIEATLPEARVLYYWNSEWRVHLSWAWENMTYSIREKGDYDRKKITFESYRTTAGVTHKLPGDLYVTGEIGLLRGRNVVFERTPAFMADEIDIENAVFTRVGVGGTF